MLFANISPEHSTPFYSKARPLKCDSYLKTYNSCILVILHARNVNIFLDSKGKIAKNIKLACRHLIFNSIKKPLQKLFCILAPDSNLTAKRKVWSYSPCRYSCAWLGFCL